MAALANVHEAEVEVLRLLHREELKSQVPRILAHAESQLGNKDDGLIRLRSDWERANKKGRSIPKETKDIAAATLHAANEVEDEQRARVHSFTQILICSIVIMFLIAIAFAIWASLDREVARIFCFPDENIVNLRHCPIGFNAEGSDIFLVEFTGMFAAALAGAVSLRRMQGTSGPYHVSVLLLLLRLPVGALTALLGILLISGEFFPGLTRLDSGPQIIAWAAAFGVLQETVTRTVDKQGRAILSGASEEGSGAPQPPEQEDSDRAGAKPGPKNRKLTRKEGQG
ncbi:hypothetical protein [Streptomyces albidus (ex Kaewkla and Franco 2022)]|uniref:hypothetical protein n=1 Tax=Streptomyces albidus (ex Kaewkla and Franco 2022) TaxID=722709 RepID=UPI0015EF44CA|nr:hypothetical protein [Streptomyces albidus (ex Kaewkla and Franco 2022)]